jgi:hypothetical protein
MKIFLATLMAMMMSLSITSCINGEDNTKRDNEPIIGQVKDGTFGLSFINLTSYDYLGYTAVSKNMPTDMPTLYSGDFILTACSYDTQTDVDNANKTMNVTVNYVEKISGNSVIGTTKSEDDSEGSLYKSNRGIKSLNEAGAPNMIDNYNLFMGISYFGQEKASDHTFSLVYHTDASEMTGTTLKIYLRHTSQETQDKETYAGFSYKIFNLSQPLTEFRSVTGNYPTTITIVAEINNVDASVPNTTTNVTMSYKYTEPQS